MTFNSLTRNLHIITLNVPYPPDYGGMIDTFYRIKALHGLGIKIHLHCFQYGRQQSKELLANLIKYKYPILFDGLHTTFYLSHPALSDRRKLVRAHNIEHNYYRSLKPFETNPLKKLYFQIESHKLKRYEKVIGEANRILAISGVDQEYFNRLYNNAELILPSHPFCKIQGLPGFGKYILYHGDLSVKENGAIAESLISGVFSKVDYPCIIAGRNPSKNLFLVASNRPEIRVIPNPDSIEMKSLIQNAHINIIPSLASNGYKLKVLFALFAGRHCLINKVSAEGNPLIDLCNIADSNDEFILLINKLMKEPFTEEEIDERGKLLSEDFDNLNNARKVMDLFFTD